ncbi:hypothetical protein HI814_03175 [Ralstonia solanacearum]|nr:hypothetical protein HI814_03175 [Ralstonia solanacearum]QKM31800.1 hypothetical protein HI794_03175 [Ralstonia solanacearum]QKM36783.1 hypothetical protein HI793_03175 [Ralstonia solanacearum]
MSRSLAAKRPERTLEQGGAQLADGAPTAGTYGWPTGLHERRAVSRGDWDDMGGLHDLPDDSNIERWWDAAREIENRHRQVLEQDFDSDAVCFQAYLGRVALLNALPHLSAQQCGEGGLDEKDEAFAELIETYPLAPEFFKDRDGVYRRSMVCFCSELLKAKSALSAGLVEKAWWHLVRVSFYDGQVQGYYLAAKSAEDKKQSGKRGGIAKEANKQRTARNACIDHLKGDRPPGGWTSPTAAIDAVAPKVEDMIRKLREEIDVRELLYAWLNGDPEVQQAGGFRMRCTKE